MRVPLGLLAPAALLAAVALSAPGLTGCDSESPFACESTDVYAFEDTTPDSVTTFGPTIGARDCAVVRYVGRLTDGTVFDSTNASGIPLSPTGTAPGRSGTVAGFARALTGRRVGESFSVTIPPNLGYGPGDRPAGRLGVAIPSCSTLEFDVTVLDTAPPAACPF